MSTALARHLDFAPPPPPGLLGGFSAAVLAHALLAWALAWGTQWNTETPLETVQAELWSSAALQAAPRLTQEPPAQEARPAETPSIAADLPAPVAAPPPTTPDIVVERQEQSKQKAELEKTLLEDKLKLAALQNEVAKRDAAAKAKDAVQKLARQTAADRAAKELEDAAEAKRTEAQRALNLKRMTGMAGATGDANAGGQALISSGPSAGYAGRIKGRIKPNIVYTDDVVGNPKTEVEVRTAPDGTIIGRRILKASGVRSWDESVLKAIDKTEVLPKDENGRVPALLIIEFKPRD